LWVLTKGNHPPETHTARPRPSPYPTGGHSEAAARLAHYFLLGALLRGQRALFLDAANCFNPHRLAEMIARVGEKRAGHGPAPTQTRAEELLARVRLSRAFTCFQLAELVERVPAEARRSGARCVFLTGVPEIFDDEELQADEARRVFSRALAGLRRWRSCDRPSGRMNQRASPLSTLVFTSAAASLRPEPSGLRRWLAAQLERAADGVFRFEESPSGLAVRGGENVPALCAFSATSAPLW
jgi:hypothetical protein